MNILDFLGHDIDKKMLSTIVGMLVNLYLQTENNFFVLWCRKGVGEGESGKKPKTTPVRIRVGNLIELTTFRRNETTMEMTMLTEDNEDDEIIV